MNWMPKPEQSLPEFFGRPQTDGLGRSPRGSPFIASSELPTISARHAAIADLTVETLQGVTVEGHTLVISVFGPMTFQALPDVIAFVFAKETGSNRRQYFMPEVEFAYFDGGFVESWFTFTSDSATLGLLLKNTKNIAWGSGMVIGGVQVPDAVVNRVLRACPFVPATLAYYDDNVRFAFQLNSDVDELAVFVPVGQTNVTLPALE